MIRIASSALRILVGPLLFTAGLWAEELGENPYWAGDFETTMFTGGYSNNRGVTITDTANHTPGGAHSWELRPGYQHLEILIEGERNQRVSFWALSPFDYELHLKVVAQAAPGQTDGKPYRDINHYIPIEAGNEWRYYEYDFYTEDSYPSVQEAEILLIFGNNHEQSTFIDDLQFRTVGPPTIKPEPTLPWRDTGLIHNGSFTENAAGWQSERGLAPVVTVDGRDVLRFGDPEVGDAIAVEQLIRNHGLAGNTIRLEAEVSYLTNRVPENAWHGLVFELYDGERAKGKTLPSIPEHFWHPFCRSVRTGEFQTVFAIYEIPAESDHLFLRLALAEKARRNVLALDEIRILTVSP